ncbi:MAG: DUF3047 domain-containing protein [Deltaproteobacteria bacterium]|nr:DUF3047 domain-containing protein [Deltaproteobacteria bacterium]
MGRIDGRDRIFAVLVLGWLLAAAFPAGGEAAGGTGGWREHSLGWLTGYPERKVAAGDNAIEAEFLLRPGTGIALEKAGRWPVGGGERLDVTLFTDNVNRTSRDYDPHASRFPVSITVVFGEDRVPLPLKRRVTDFLSHLWYGFPPRGIRIVYAWGDRVPAGSMYRPADEETVFTLAGEEDVGKRIAAQRNLAEDFRAAYGRGPKGPVTRLIVRAERPRGEAGNIRSGIAASFPAR